MDLEHHVAPIIDFVRVHQGWAPPIVGVLAFLESVAVISLLVPATMILLGLGAMFGAAGLGLDTAQFWIICGAGGIGAMLGDTVSYEFGRYYDERAKHVWPLDRYPQLIATGEEFVRRWGVPGIFIGRFFGPARAAVPLVAGIFDMPRGPFQVANITSGFVWAFIMLAPGSGLFSWIRG